MSGDEVTTGELGRRIDDLKGAVDAIAVELRRQGEHRAGDYVRLGALEARVSALERWQTWAVRTVVGLVIVAAVGLLIQTAAPTG